MTLFYEKATARTIGALRVWVFGLWLFKVAIDPFQTVSGLPKAAYSPVGVLHLLPPGIWPVVLAPGALLALRVAICLSLVFAVLGVATRRACALAALLLLFEQGVLRGFGQLNHCELGLLYCALLLPLFPCGDAFALRPRRGAPAPASHYQACALTLAAMFCATYFFPGANRVVDTPDLLFSGAMRRYAVDNSFHDSRPWSALVRRIVTTAPGAFALAAALPFVTVFELLAPLCLVSEKFRWAFVRVMTVFHVMAAIIMNVIFWENVLLYVLLIDLEPWLVRGEALWRKRVQKTPSQIGGGTA